MKFLFNTKITEEQKEIMVSFLEVHPELVSSKFTPTFTKAVAIGMWKELGDLLNVAPGASKNAASWRKTWHDLRRSAEERCLSSSQNVATSEETKHEADEQDAAAAYLSNTQQRILQLIQTADSRVYAQKSQNVVKIKAIIKKKAIANKIKKKLCAVESVESPVVWSVQPGTSSEPEMIVDQDLLVTHDYARLHTEETPAVEVTHEAEPQYRSHVDWRIEQLRCTEERQDKMLLLREREVEAREKSAAALERIAAALEAKYS